MASAPIWTATPRYGVGQVSSADTSLTSASGVAIFAAGANGSLLREVVVQATVATTAGFVRLFLESGGTHRLWKEIPVTASGALSATVAAFTYRLNLVDSRNPYGQELPNGYTLRATTHNAEAFNVHAWGGDI